MSYQQQIDIIVNGINQIDQIVNHANRATEAIDNLRASIAAIPEDFGQSVGRANAEARRLRQLDRIADAAAGRTQRRLRQSRLASRRGESPSPVERQMLGESLSRQRKELAAIRQQRLANARAYLNLRALRAERNKFNRELELQTSRTGRFAASLGEVVAGPRFRGGLVGQFQTGINLSRRFKTDVRLSRRNRIVAQFDRRNAPTNATRFARDLAQRAEVLTTRQDSINEYVDRINQAQERIEGMLRQLPLPAAGRPGNSLRRQRATFTRALGRINRLRESLSVESGAIGEEMRQLSFINEARSDIARRAQKAEGQMVGLRRRGVMSQRTVDDISKILGQASAQANLARNPNIGLAKSLLREAESRIQSNERRERLENGITNELVSQRRELTTINALEERINRLREAGVSEARLAAPTQMVGELRSAAEARNLREYRVGLVGARDALTELENAEARRNRTLTQSERLSRARNQLSKQRDSSMLREIKDFRSLDVLERRISNLGEDPAAVGLRQQVGAARQALQAGDMGQFARDLEISKNAIEDAEDAQKTYNRTLARTNQLSSIESKILQGKRISLGELAKWQRGGGAPGAPGGAGGRQQLMLPPVPAGQPSTTPGGLPVTLGGARLRGISREFIVGPTGQRTNIPAFEQQMISGNLPPEIATKAARPLTKTQAQFKTAFEQFVPKELGDLLLKGFGNFTKKLPNVIGKAFDEAGKRNEKAIKAGNEYARLLEQEIVAAEKLGQINAGVFDDSDLKNFLAGLQETEDSYKKLLNVGKSWDKDYRQRQALVKEGLTQERNFNKAQSGIIADVQKFGQQLTQLGEAGVIKPKTLERWRDTLRSAGGDARNLRRPFEDIRADLDKIIPGISAVASRAKNVKKTTGGAKAGGILRTGEFSPVGGNVRLENILGSAKILEQRLLNLQADGVDVAGVLADLQKEVNRAKQADYDISIKNLGILDQTLNKTRQFIQFENAVAAGKPRIAGATKTGQFPFSPVRGTEAIAGSPKFVEAQNKLIDGVRNAGVKASNLFERGIVSQSAIDQLRLALDEIKTAAQQATIPFNRLSERLAGLNRGLAEVSAGARDRRSLSRTFADIRERRAEDAAFLGGRSPQQAISAIVGTFNRPYQKSIDEAKAAGGNVTKTFATNLKAGAPAAFGAAISFAESAVRGIKKALGIASPSRVMIEIALNLVNTYINQLEKEYPRIRAATARAFGEETLQREVKGIRASTSEVRPGVFGYETTSRPSTGFRSFPPGERFGSPRAGETMEFQIMMRRFRQQIADLTTQPAIYEQILNALPNSRITTDLLNTASRRLSATELLPSFMPTQRQLGPGELEKKIQADFASYLRDVRIPNPWIGPTGDFQNFVNSIVSSAQRLKAQAILPPSTGTAGALPPATSPTLADIQSARVTQAYQRSAQRSASVMMESVGGGGFGSLPPGRQSSGGAGGPSDDLGGAAGRAARELLTFSDMFDPMRASINDLQDFQQAVNSIRNTLNGTEPEFETLDRELREVSARLGRTLERRDVGADFLTRQFTSRGAAAISEGLIGGAFPLLFGQGVGASILGGAGGAAGGFMGGGLGFGLSLLGTFLGSAFDSLITSTTETGSALKDLVGNFDAIKQASLISSSANEKVIQSLIDSGRVATAYDLIQADLNRTIGAAGVQSLQSASTASDRLNRAMAELGKQLEVFVAGPLAGFLNAIAGVVERVNLENRAGRVFEGLSPERAKAFQRDLREAAPKQVIPFFGDAGKFGASSGGDVRAAIPSNVFNQILAKYEAQLPQPKQTDQQKAEAAVRSAQEALANQQQVADIQGKRAEARDAINAFRQEALSITREQQDLDRQGFDLRRQYEEQIGDIRRSIAERVTQIEQENRQRELDVVIKQGEIRQAQLRNAGLTMQRELAGDELASGLADAVQTYLESQLSAQNQIEQRRKQFEVEMINQQIEADKFKIDTNRAISKLNTDTARQVEQINIGIARRNEDMRMKNFETERDMAGIRLVTMKREAELTKAQFMQRRGEAKLAVERNPADTAAQSRLTETAQSIVDIEDSISAITKAASVVKSLKAPAQLTGLQPVKALGVSFAGVDKAAGKAKQLQGTLKNMLDTLDQLAAGGDKLTFLTTLDNFAFGEAVQRQNDLNQAMSEASALLYGAASGADIISRSYANLSAKIQANTAYTDAEKQKMLALLRVYEPAQLALQELAYTQEYYTETLQDNSNSIQEARDSINGLLSPVSEYKKQLAIIQASGGVAVLGNQAQKLLETATEVDRLNEKLSTLNGLSEIAGAWTDSFMSFNKELLKTGNLMDSLSNFVEDIAGKSIDMLVEFALKPMQERMFKSMADFLGFEPEANPLLKPIESIDKTLGDVKKLSEQMLGVIRARQKAVDAVAQGVGTASAQNDLVGQSATAMVPEIKRLIAAGADPGLPSGERFAAGMSDADIVSMLRRAVVQMPGANGGLGFDIETRQGFSVPSNLLEQQATLSSIAGSIAQRYGVPMSFLAGSSSATPLQRLSATGRPSVTPAPAPVGQSGGRDVFALPGDTPLPTPTAAISTPAAEAANNIRAMSAASADAAAIAAQRNTAEQESIAKIKQFGQSLGTGIQVLGGIAMAVGGVQAIRKGGAYNTLMGLSGIFGGISSIAGSFSKIGGGGSSGITSVGDPLPGSIKGFAKGGRPPLYQPSWIGENGPELWMPDQAGTVIPVDDLFVPGLDGPGAAPDMAAPYARSGGRMAREEAPDSPSGGIPYTRSGYGSTIPYQRTDSTREIERIDRAISSPGELPPIKYETQRVNEYDFVTPDQLERSNQRTAQVARKMTLQEIADSLRTRNRLGIP